MASPKNGARFSANFALSSDNLVISFGLFEYSWFVTTVLIQRLNSFCPSAAAAYFIDTISELRANLFTSLSREIASAVSLVMISAAYFSS